MEFSKRQAGGIQKFFEDIRVPEEQRDAHRLRLVGAVDRGPGNYTTCEVCGHGGIRYEFHLSDVDNGGDLIAGSNCIETFLGANKHLVGEVKDEAKRLIRQARKNKATDDRKLLREKNLHDLKIARGMIHDFAVQTGSDESRVLEMLDGCIENNYPFTEPRRRWARDRVRHLRTLPVK
jgi:hypothetical protein